MHNGCVTIKSSYIAACSVSAAAMREVLLFMYGGVIELPPGSSECVLLHVADMYAVDGLKETVALALRAHKCHFFHKVFAAVI